MTSNKGGGAGRRDASPVISASVTPALAGTTSQSRARASPRVDSALSSLVPGYAERLTPSKQRAVRILSSSETLALDEADDYEQSYAEMMHPHRCRVAVRRWQRHVTQRSADLALRRAAGALGVRLERARALRQWSALRIAHQQSEITKLHQVAAWHLNTLMGAGGSPRSKHDPADKARKLVRKWAMALLSAAFNSWFQVCGSLPSHFDASPSVHPLDE